METKDQKSVADATEALSLLYSSPRYEDNSKKRLVCDSRMPTAPCTIVSEEYHPLHLIEQSWEGDTEGFLPGGKITRPIGQEIVTELITNEWVEEVEPCVFKISLLGIAIFARRRMLKLEREISGN